MNEENHIIKFDHDKLIIRDIIIRNYTIYNRENINRGIINYYINIRCYYHDMFYKLNYNKYDCTFNLSNMVYKLNYNKYDCTFNLSNMLYKLHTKDYYSRIRWNKELI